VIAKLLRHPVSTATFAEPPHGAGDRLGDHIGGRGIRWLQLAGQKRLALCVAEVLSRRG